MEDALIFILNINNCPIVWFEYINRERHIAWLGEYRKRLKLICVIFYSCSYL